MGPQELMARSDADLAIMSSMPGSGKSMVTAMELVRWKHLENYQGVGFRAHANELVGGVNSLYRVLKKVAPDARATKAPTPALEWPNGSIVQLLHGNTDPSVLDGSEIALCVFDELQHFERDFFDYVTISRGRTMCGLVPYTRASCMPTPSAQWLRDLVQPWLREGGYQDWDQSGRKRWMVRDPKDIPQWFDSHQDALDYAGPIGGDPISVAFVFARTQDNLALMAADPDYVRRLSRLDPVERLRLRDACWDPAPGAGMYFQRGWFRVYDTVPEPQVILSVRGWDRAASEPKPSYKDPDYTRGIRLDLLASGICIVSDMVSCRKGLGGVHDLIRDTARLDGPNVAQCFWRDPASSGIAEEEYLRAELANVVGCGPIHIEPQNLNINTERLAKVVSTYADRSTELDRPGFGIVRAGWNSQFMFELEQYPTVGVHDDIVSALARGWMHARGRLITQQAGMHPAQHAFLRSLRGGLR